MNTIGNNKALKLLTAVLVLLLLGLGIYTIKFYNTVQDNELELIREKEMIELELRDMLGKYDTQQAMTSDVRQQLDSAQTRITKLLDSLATSENTRDVLRNYRVEITKLRDQRDLLLQKNDSLAVLTQNLQNEKTAVKKAFDSSLVERDSLRLQNKALQDELNAKTALRVDSLDASGIIVRRSGKHLVNDLAKRIDNIEVCYTLHGALTEDNIQLYVQIIDPQNNVIGERNSITFGEKVLLYSAIDQANTSAITASAPRCVLVAPYSAKFQEGIYRINIFQEDRLMASTLLQLD
ncbi:MAG TPA: hypothetical protein ENH91_10520 [Leeuwenhoekiella sp.]|nr:hypothetical protein [Leeuwenhoekiella sp.]